MKRIFHLLTALTALTVLACSCSSKAPLKPIVILYENDVHCSIDGYAILAGLRNEIAAADTAYVALTSSGDYLQGGNAGSLTRGEAIMRVIDLVGYDAMSLGNHEFDYYTPQLFALLEAHKPPVTCLNLYDMEGNAVLPPYFIRQYGPRKVAFVGVLTAETMADERYAFYNEAGDQLFDLRNDDLPVLTQAAVDAARKEGADYVILLAHLGEVEGAKYAGSHEIVAATSGIDAVLDGHTHSTIPCQYIQNKEGKPVPVSQTGTGLKIIGKMVIGTDGSISCELLPTQDITARDSTVAACIGQINAELDAIRNVVVGESEVDLLITDGKGERMVRKAETNTGDLLTDAMRSILDADIALTNGGGIRTDVKAGTLTYGDINNIFPFINHLCKIEATGDDILAVLDRCTRLAPEAENGDFPQCSGIRCTIHTGDRRLSDVMVQKADGKWVPLDPEATYTVATIAYCVRDGGFNLLFAECPVLKQTEILYCDAVVTYIKETLGGHIGKEYAKPQGRLVFVP